MHLGRGVGSLHPLCHRVQFVEVPGGRDVDHGGGYRKARRCVEHVSRGHEDYLCGLLILSISQDRSWIREGAASGLKLCKRAQESLRASQLTYSRNENLGHLNLSFG